jgi:hypothetical protein
VICGALDHIGRRPIGLVYIDGTHGFHEGLHWSVVLAFGTIALEDRVVFMSPRL